MQDYFLFLKGLTGKWEGTGWAEYPTINNTEYREELSFSANDKDRVIQYEEKTWIEVPASVGEQPIFWECGFFVFKDVHMLSLVALYKNVSIFFSNHNMALQFLLW